MLYRVKDDAARPVRWPDGTVRAEAGQVFDGMDTPGTPTYLLAAGWLRGQTSICVPAPDATPNAGEPIPAAMLARLRSVGAPGGAVAYVTRETPQEPASDPEPDDVSEGAEPDEGQDTGSEDVGERPW